MNVDAKLTAEENRVVQFVAWGCPYKIIADRLCKSVHRVTNQIRSACEKIGITPGELPAWWFCTRFGISFDLSPIRRKAGAIMLLILFCSQIGNCDSIARRVRRGRRNETEYIAEF